jgi:hypothetical protein
MVLSTIPSTVGEADDRDTSRGMVFEIGRDKQSLPPAASAMFPPFIKYQYSYYPPSGRVLFLYSNALLQEYGIDSAGKLTRIGIMNMYGGQIFYSSIGAQYIPGSNQFLNLRIKMGLSSYTYVATSYYSSLYNVAGPSIVFYRPGWHAVYGAHMKYMDFPLDIPFDYDGTSSLLVEIEWDALSGYGVGSNYGGTWTTSPYSYLNGNLFSGFFYHTSSSMLWSPFYSTTTGSRYTNLVVLLIEGEFGIPADIRMEPQSLNLESNGNYMNVKVESFPENPEYTALDVSHGTCEVLKIGCDLKFGTWNENKYITKVDRLLVEDAIGAPGDDTELEVTGYLADGTHFKGIAIIDTHSNA